MGLKWCKHKRHRGAHGDQRAVDEIEPEFELTADDYYKQTEEQQMVQSWFQHSLDLPQYYQLFIDSGYRSMGMIKTIQSKEDLSEIGITKVGHRTFIMRQIQELHKEEPMNYIKPPGQQQSVHKQSMDVDDIYIDMADEKMHNEEQEEIQINMNGEPSQPRMSTRSIVNMFNNSTPSASTFQTPLLAAQYTSFEMGSLKPEPILGDIAIKM
eukprot:63487_1